MAMTRLRYQLVGAMAGGTTATTAAAVTTGDDGEGSFRIGQSNATTARRT